MTLILVWMDWFASNTNTQMCSEMILASLTSSRKVVGSRLRDYWQCTCLQCPLMDIREHYPPYDFYASCDFQQHPVATSTCPTSEQDISGEKPSTQPQVLSIFLWWYTSVLYLVSTQDAHRSNENYLTAKVGGLVISVTFHWTWEEIRVWAPN